MAFADVTTFCNFFDSISGTQINCKYGTSTSMKKWTWKCEHMALAVADVLNINVQNDDKPRMDHIGHDHHADD